MINQKFTNIFKNSQTNWKYILIVVILAILVAIGTLWFLAKQELPYQPPEIKKPEKAAENETADWKTYTNEEYGFEIKYPQGWVIKNKEIKNSNSDSYLFISQLKNKENLTLNEWFDKSTIVNVNDRPTLLRSSEDIVVNGLKAKIYRSELDPPNPVWHIHIADQNNRIFSLYAYAFTVEDKNILDQMLSIFKFIK